MNTTNGYLSAEALWKSGLTDVELSGGRKVQIAKLSTEALARHIRCLPDLAVFLDVAKDDMATALQNDNAPARLAIIDQVILDGVIQPKLGKDPTVGPTPAFFDLPDRLILFAAILSHAGYSQAAAEEVAPLSETPI